MKKSQKSFIKITCQVCNGSGTYVPLGCHHLDDCHTCSGKGYYKMKRMKGTKMTNKRKINGWVTVKQAAFALGILPKSIMRRIQRGTMKFKTQKDGTRLVYLAA